MNAKRLQELINITHRHGVELARAIRDLERRGLGKTGEALHLQNVRRGLEGLNKRRRQELTALEPASYAMFDSIEVSAIPKNPTAVAGYVNGRWPTYRELVTRFPNAKHLSIDVFGSEPAADCLDIENGDATPADAPAWYFRKKFKDTTSRPCFYANLSTMPKVRGELTLHGIMREHYRLWVADYTYTPHIPMGFDACQWTDKALGRNLDQSLCFRGFIQ